MRLRAVGIKPRASRTRALIQLGAALPPQVLADLLNLHPSTAVRWVKAAGGDWTSYAARRVEERAHDAIERRGTDMLEPLIVPATPPTLKGDRVVLRTPRESDIDDRLSYPIDPDEEDAYGGGWRRDWDGRLAHTRDDLAQRRSHPRPGEIEWSVEYAGECIGSARLRVDQGNHRAAFSVGIFAPHRRGMGLGREITRLVIRWGFVDLGLHRVELDVLATNERAIRCYRACGFVHEGTRREAELYPDGWHDFLVMGLLRDDLARGATELGVPT